MSEARILKNADKQRVIPEKTFPGFILDQAHRFKNRVYLIEHETGREFTYSDFERDTLRFAKVLKELDLRPGETFMVYGYNCYEMYVTLIAGLAVGGIGISVRGQDTHYEVQREIGVRNVTWLFVQQELVSNILKIEVLERVKVFFFDGDEQQCLQVPSLRTLAKNSDLLPREELFTPPNLRTTPALIMESSGTTGPAKGALLSHFTLIGYFVVPSPVIETLEDDILLTGSPLAHLTGVAFAFFPFLAGAKVIILRVNASDNLPELIEKYNVTKIWPSQSTVMNLVKANACYTLPTLRNVGLGGERTRVAVPEMFIKRFKPTVFVNGYGLTEAGTVCTAVDITALAPSTVGFDCVGKVLPDVELKVINPKTSQILAPNESGEICVRTRTMFIGYHDDPERTKATVDEENWIHTGDIGYYDEQEYLYIIGRTKDLIDQKGYHFPAADLEDILLRHEAVKDVCVLGIPDATGGDLAHAFVIKKDNSNVTAADLKSYVNERITAVKRLEGDVHFLSEFPTTAFGKIKRNELCERYKAMA